MQMTKFASCAIPMIVLVASCSQSSREAPSPRSRHIEPAPARDAGRPTDVSKSTPRATSLSPPASPPVLVLTRRDLPGLHNVIELPDGLISGSDPHGREGFESLKKLGVKTIISVDGAAPDAESARALGMRYVHLPIGYDGIEPDRCIALAKAVRELPAPVYVHCHHGMHRGPAAAAYVMVGLRRMTVDAALAFMKTAGTSDKYAHLYEVVAEARPIDDGRLDAESPELPERAVVSDLTDHMAALGRVWDHIREIRAAGWRAPESNPDLDPRNEAVILAEQFRELARLDELKSRPADFLAMLRESETAAWQMSRATDAAGRDAAFAIVNDQCNACHKAYRDY